MTDLAEKIEPKKRTLNEIVEDFRRVLHCIDDAEGELTPELEQSLTEAEGELSTKVDRCLWVAREAEAQAEVYAERAKALADRAAVLKGQAKRLEKYVHGAMLTLGVKRVETPNFVATIAETGGSVVVDNEDSFIRNELVNSVITCNITKECFNSGYKKDTESSWVSVQMNPDQIAFGPFVRIKYELNKQAISMVLKSGTEIKGARLVKGTSLRVK
jgi:uncharacterized Zn ribbon protein